MKRLAIGLVVLMTCASVSAASLELKKGDHICLIGNSLAERMQHDGWLETFVHSRFPTSELVFRNLGFSGDELTVRLRSDGFGSPDEHLTTLKADVILALFGFNESFAGPDGVDKFKQDLGKFVDDTLSHKYNGQTPPRLVLVSPIAQENLRDRNLADGSENNRRLEMYTAAMAEVAAAKQVSFVDLFHPTRDQYPGSFLPWTVDGVHLTDYGNQRVGQILDEALFGKRPETAPNPGSLGKLRQAVQDKDYYWFHRHRTLDGYNVYGGRSSLKYMENISNRDVMDREMEILDVMAANRDRRIWAVAQGQELSVSDDNTPSPIPVKTNKPGDGPNGEHIFLGGDLAIEKMTLGQGLKINLFASEEMFPEVVNPVQMAWDTAGRLWIAVWPTYPHWTPKEPMNDKLLVLEDTDGDGRADRCTAFADDLNCPTGFEFWNGGVLVAQAPYLIFMKDTDGDGRADFRQRMQDGLDSADSHHTANSFVFDPGGALYFQEGVFHRTQSETPYGPQRNFNACVWRFEPRTFKFERYVAYDFANPHGHVFDAWGQGVVIDGTGAQPYHDTLFSGYLEHPQRHGGPPQLYSQRTRPCPAAEILSSRHFPPEYQGNLLVPNVIGFQGILRYRIEDAGSSFRGVEVEPMVSSTDPNFRPADVEVGPDGAVYFTDWQNPIIGHMQHHLRDPNRDKTHGRVYRITYASRPLLSPPKIAGEPIDALVELLRSPEDRVRYRARIELSGRDTNEVLAAVARWTQSLDQGDPDYEHHLLEALWMHQQHNVVNEDLLGRMLSSKDYRARAAATRVLCTWRDRVPDSLEKLKQLAADEHPRVRLEAVRAASFIREPEAVEVPLISAERPSDQYLDYTRGETMKSLEPLWKQALASGKSIRVSSDGATKFLLKNMTVDDLLKMPGSRLVHQEVVSRRGVRDEVRRQAIAELAKLENKSEIAVLLGALKSLDDPAAGQDESLAFDLVRLLTARSPAELAEARGELETMATSAKQPAARQLGFVALIAADRSIDRAWDLAAKSVPALVDLVSAMPLVRDPALRAALYPKVEPLLAGLPKPLQSTDAAKETRGRYIRIELPGRRRTLTLAEVEVYSDGRNIARQGKARQVNTSNDGDASRAIDGNRSGVFGDGGQTHTAEGLRDPWWEVDLGSEQPIDSIVVYNRKEGELGRRLDGFTLSVLDGRRQPVFARQRIPAPPEKLGIALEGARPESAIRRAAMLALTSVRGQEAHTFQALSPFVAAGEDRAAAIQAIQRIPVAHWPAADAQPLLTSVLEYVRSFSAQDRTSPAAVDALQFAYSLASLLPADRAKQVRQELGDLGVQVIRLGTVPDQMLFDKERLAVQAGKPVEIVFENSDLMPHNFVITRPGALEEIGLLAEATAQTPGAAERQYVPGSKSILLSSRLLQPREVDKLSFTAPKEPGVYPYVCTYPGHWRRMYGALYVVENLEEYTADPEAYLAAHPLQVADELLKFSRPRKEWKTDDLAPYLTELGKGRSFTNGKQMFQVATCVACHRLVGTGNEFGPDLAQLDTKLQTADILREIIEPSSKINEKYQSYVFTTDAGRIVTGLVLSETPDAVKIVENPVASAQPIELKKAEIASREKSPTSLMPKGLLDKLTPQEILDLLAFVASRGDEKHAMFQGQHDHAGH